MIGIAPNKKYRNRRNLPVSTIVHILKAILVIFSIYLAYKQHKSNNSTLRNYWIVVALYWFFNLLSGLIH